MPKQKRVKKGLAFKSSNLGQIIVTTGKSIYSKELKTTYYEVIIPGKPKGENKFFVNLAFYTPFKSESERESKKFPSAMKNQGQKTIDERGVICCNECGNPMRYVTEAGYYCDECEFFSMGDHLEMEYPKCSSMLTMPIRHFRCQYCRFIHSY